MLRVAIVGCGKIADAHASQIQRIGGCELVGVCDREELMARQLAERFHVREYFSDVTELMNAARPDVVHVTTPPQSHFEIARRSLDAGCNVYIEKPFALYRTEAEELIRLAERKKLKVTAGHDDQFRHAARRRLYASRVPRSPVRNHPLLNDANGRIRKSSAWRPESLGAWAPGWTAAQYHQPWDRPDRRISCG